MDSIHCLRVFVFSIIIKQWMPENTKKADDFHFRLAIFSPLSRANLAGYTRIGDAAVPQHWKMFRFAAKIMLSLEKPPLRSCAVECKCCRICGFRSHLIHGLQSCNRAKKNWSKFISQKPNLTPSSCICINRGQNSNRKGAAKKWNRIAWQIW